MASPELDTPALRTVDVADSEDGWAGAGFCVVDASVDIGGINIRLGRSVEATSWSFDGLDAVDEIDGIPVTSCADLVSKAAESAEPHPNGSFHLDHVVMISPDLRRTVPALESNGFEVKRRRDIGKGREQVFLWAGQAIIELVGPTAPETSSDEPSDLWGLAMSTNDIDGAATLMGDRLGRVKDAVQPGRRIATVRTSDLGITPTIALMTPHT